VLRKDGGESHSLSAATPQRTRRGVLGSNLELWVTMYHVLKFLCNTTNSTKSVALILCSLICQTCSAIQIPDSTCTRA
jgi:hypothetical protein